MDLDKLSWPALPDLKSRQDWLPWIQEVEVLAKLKGVWRYMDPESEAELESPTLPPEPEEGLHQQENDIPEQEQFYVTYRDATVQFDTSGFNRAVQIFQLREEQQHRQFIRSMELYKFKMQRHTIALSEYNKQKNILDHLFLAMKKTVGPEYKDLIAKYESPRAIITKLRETLVPVPKEQDKKLAMAEYWRSVIWQGQESRESSREPSPEREGNEDEDAAADAAATAAALARSFSSATAAAIRIAKEEAGISVPVSNAPSVAGAANTSKSSGESATAGQKSPKRSVCPGCGKGHGMKPETWWEHCWSFLAMHDVGGVPKGFNRIVKREAAIMKRLDENKAERIAAIHWVEEEMKKRNHNHNNHNNGHNSTKEKGSNFGHSRPPTPYHLEKQEYSFNGHNLIGFAMV